MPVDVVKTLRWGHDALAAVVEIHPDRPVALQRLGPPGEQPRRLSQPLVEVLIPGEGRAKASQRLSETAVGCRLRYAGAEQGRDGDWHTLRIALKDEVSGLAAEVTLRSYEGVAACQIQVKVTNQGTGPVLLLAVSSFAAGFLGRSVSELDVLSADSEWLGESRWSRRPLGDHIADLNLAAHGQHGRGRFALSSTGTWSSGRHVPMGGLADRRTGQTWLWQIEHNGAWGWETGERLDGVYVVATGPTDVDHQWSQTLAAGESFTTVPVSVAVSAGAGAEAEAGAEADGLEGAVAALTAHRRALLRPHPDRSALPVVFNDYMNTLMGDPTTAKLLPLVDAAAAAGAEIFCIDAGWYDDDGAWWDSVGEWEPSRTRFPGGIQEVLGHIRERGMTPGLWLEPEVIGVRSPMADKLPPEAFLQRGGHRLTEHGRHHLDLRHPAAVAHLDQVVDRLVEELGVGYFKLDYNINPGTGTDLDADSAGAGLLACNRAHLAWLDGVLDRHPELVLENCASGAMRMDYALLSRLNLQSTSDQQDFLRYPPIAVSAPLSMLPEQAASWAYPQPEMTDEELVFTMCTGVLGRLYLSGNLHAMSAAQLDLVRAGVRAHRDLRADLVRAVPCWPLGLPGWDDPWLALGLRAGDTTHLGLWRRPGAAETAILSLPHLAGRRLRIETGYPGYAEGWGHSWDPSTAELSVTSAITGPTARILKVTPQ